MDPRLDAIAQLLLKNPQAKWADLTGQQLLVGISMAKDQGIPLTPETPRSTTSGGNLVTYDPTTGNIINTQQLPPPINLSISQQPGTGSAALSLEDIKAAAQESGGKLTNKGGVYIATFSDGSSVQYDPMGVRGGAVQYNATFKPAPKPGTTSNRPLSATALNSADIFARLREGAGYQQGGGSATGGRTASPEAFADDGGGGGNFPYQGDAAAAARELGREPVPGFDPRNSLERDYGFSPEMMQAFRNPDGPSNIFNPAATFMAQLATFTDPTQQDIQRGNLPSMMGILEGTGIKPSQNPDIARQQLMDIMSQRADYMTTYPRARLSDMSRALTLSNQSNRFEPNQLSAPGNGFGGNPAEYHRVNNLIRNGQVTGGLDPTPGYDWKAMPYYDFPDDQSVYTPPPPEPDDDDPVMFARGGSVIGGADDMPVYDWGPGDGPAPTPWDQFAQIGRRPLDEYPIGRRRPRAPRWRGYSGQGPAVFAPAGENAYSAPPPLMMAGGGMGMGGMIPGQSAGMGMGGRPSRNAFQTPEEIGMVGLNSGKLYAVVGEGQDGIGGQTAPERVDITPMMGGRKKKMMPRASQAAFAPMMSAMSGNDRRVPFRPGYST